MAVQFLIVLRLAALGTQCITYSMEQSPS